MVLAVNTPSPGSSFPGAHDVTVHGGVFNAIAGDHNVTQNIVVNNYQQPPTCRSKSGNQRDLSDLPPSNFENIQRQLYESRAPGTGEVFLKRPKFQSWLSQDFPVLCATGMPGAGKSHQAAMVVDHLTKLADQSDDTMVTYAYIRYSDSVRMHGILSGVLRQIARRDASAHELIASVYAQHARDKTEPTVGELTDLLKTVLQPYKRRQLLLDGFDESHEDDQVEIAELASSLDASIIIFSRPSETLKAGLPDAAYTEVSADPQDIEILIDRQIARFHKLRALVDRYKIREEILSTIVKKASGMFLHAYLQLECLRHCSTLKQLRAKLDQFPVKIEDMYMQTMRRIEAQSEENVDLAKRLIIWVLYAARPLSLVEVQSALSLNLEAQDLGLDSIAIEEALADISCGLVNYEKETGVVRLVHYTAKDVLPSIIKLFQPDPHAFITIACIAQIEAHRKHGYNTACNPDGFALQCTDAPFLPYAFEMLPLHARTAHYDNIASVVEAFVFANTSFRYVGFRHSLGRCTRTCSAEVLSPLHTATFLGLSQLAEKLVAAGFSNLNPKLEEFRWTPLHIAVHAGYKDVVTFIIQHGSVEINAKDDRGCTPIQLACRRGEQDLVELLLPYPGLALNTLDEDGYTPLMRAVEATEYAESKDKDGAIVTKLLQEPSLDINYPGPGHGSQAIVFVTSPLQLAKLLAFPDLLLNVESYDGPFWSRTFTPLTYCAFTWRLESLHLLLRHPGIDVNHLDGHKKSALMYVAQQGGHEYVQALLEFPGADANLQDAEGKTAFALALKGIRNRIFRTLHHEAKRRSGRSSDWDRFWPSLAPNWRPEGDEPIKVFETLLRHSDQYNRMHHPSYFEADPSPDTLKTIEILLSFPEIHRQLGLEGEVDPLKYLWTECGEWFIGLLCKFDEDTWFVDYDSDGPSSLQSGSGSD